MPPDSSHFVAPDEGVYYPVSDDMGETGFHYYVTRQLVELLANYLESTGAPAVVGGEQFFYYRRGEPSAVVCPDAYVIDDATLAVRDIDNWKLWERGGKAPTLAVEVVSDEFKKDYADSFLDRYQQLGVRELLRYDPLATRSRKRQLLSHFVRDERGRLIQRPTLDDRVRCVSYDLWLRRHTDNSLRLGTGPSGDLLWPTSTEARLAAEARAEAEARRAEAHARRAETEAHARAAAEAQVARLQAELARLRAT